MNAQPTQRPVEAHVSATQMAIIQPRQPTTMALFFALHVQKTQQNKMGYADATLITMEMAPQPAQDPQSAQQKPLMPLQVISATVKCHQAHNSVMQTALIV